MNKLYCPKIMSNRYIKESAAKYDNIYDQKTTRSMPDVQTRTLNGVQKDATSHQIRSKTTLASFEAVIQH